MKTQAAGKVLFLVSEDWYFASHRLDFAVHLAERGYEVAVGCRCRNHENMIRAAGIKLFPLPFVRESLSVIRALCECYAVRRLYRAYQPHLVHLVALRPIVVGHVACVGLHGISFINALTGHGNAGGAARRSAHMRFVLLLANALLKRGLRRCDSYNVFQNAEDLESAVVTGLSRRDKSFLIRGAGVDLNKWNVSPEPPNDPPVVLYVGRLLREKGLGELVAASQALSGSGRKHVLRVVGSPDRGNPHSLREDELSSWHHTGVIEWLGHRSDVLEQMSRANLVVLPSYYREGLPKVLLEAGLVQRAVITCDSVGCREVVSHMVNGLLVPPRDPEALAKAIGGLLKNPELRADLAAKHHQVVSDLFSLEKISRQFLELYNLILCSRNGKVRSRA